MTGPGARRGSTSFAFGAAGVALALLVVAAGAFLGLRHDGAAPADETAGADPDLAPVFAPGTTGPFAGRGSARAATPWLAAAADAIASERAALIERLRGSRDATDSLRLYALLEDCREFRLGTSTDASACAGVSESALAGRLDALQRAVEGRAPGAVARLYEAGPAGDYQHDPSRHAQDSWRARLEPMLQDAVRHGDIPALGAAMLEYDIGIDFPRDPMRALTYVMVAMNIEREHGRDAGGLALQAARLSAELTDRQRAIATTEAQRLFVDAFQGKPAQ